MGKAFSKTDRKRRIDHILFAAVRLAALPGGWTSLTRLKIAQEAKCSPALVSAHIGDMHTVRKAIMRIAVKQGMSEIMIQSMVAHDGFYFKG